MSMNNEVRAVRVFVAASREVGDAVGDLREVFDELDAKAANENLKVRIEDTQCLEKDNARFFYRESPVHLIEQIRRDHHPDVIIGVFQRRFGSGSAAPTADPESELARAAERWVERSHPRVLLYFTENSPEPKDEEERDYFSRFRGFQPLRDFWWFYKNRSPLRGSPHERELRVLARGHLWRVITQLSAGSEPSRIDVNPPPKLNLEDTGWEHISPEFLSEFRRSLSESNRLDREEALDYFDGKDPTWKIAVSSSVRPREIVGRLVREISGAASGGKLRVTLLTGPGGEGKSTILRQIAVALAENYQGVYVIWRRQQADSLDASVIQQLAKSRGHFVLIADNAETIASDVYERVHLLSRQPNSNIQFLLASRGTDWQWRHGWSFSPWLKLLGERNFIRYTVGRLERNDARQIVEAWGELGSDGLGNLSEEPEGERARILFMRAAEEEQENIRRGGGEGSFFGAILRTRKSKTLDAFVQGLLDRLRGHPAPDGKTLEEVFAYVVTPHADNLYILSKPVLRHLLSCSSRELEREVIEPLADEAASDAREWFVLARHRMVAEKAKELLRAKYPEVKMYSELLGAAIKKIKTKDGELQEDDSKQWNNLAASLLERKRKDLALHLAETAANIEEDDPYPVVAWANILRKIDQSEKAAGGESEEDEGVDERKTDRSEKVADIFTERYDKVKGKKNRAYFFEWGVALRRINKHYSAVWLCGISLSDWAMADEWHPKYVPPMMRFAEMSISLMDLYKKASDPNDTSYNPTGAKTFLDGCAAAAKLGLDKRAQKEMPPEYDWKKSERSLKKAERFAADEGVTNVNFCDALKLIREAIILAWRLRNSDEGDLPTSLPSAEALSFQKLSALLGIEAKDKSQTPSPNFSRGL